MPDHFIFVFEEGVVSVFESVAEAEDYLEAVDVEQGTYLAAFDDLGQVYKVKPRLDNAELVRTEQSNAAELRRQLHAVHGPRHLAHEPRVYGAEQLRRDNEPSTKRPQQATHQSSRRDQR